MQPAPHGSLYMHALTIHFNFEIFKVANQFLLRSLGNVCEGPSGRHETYMAFMAFLPSMSSTVSSSRRALAAYSDMHEVQVSWATERAAGNDNGYPDGIPGTWGSWHLCATSQWAYQYRLKIDADQGNMVDDVALTSVELQCSDWSSSTFSTASTANGDALGWGTWTATEACASVPSFIDAFDVRFDPYHAGDSTAASAVSFYCGGTEHLSLPAQSAPDWGTAFTTSKVACNSGSAICGVRAQVQASQGYYYDDIALGDVAFSASVTGSGCDCGSG